MHRILIIEATEELRPLAATLEEAGFDVDGETLDRAQDSVAAAAPSVVIFGMLGRPDAGAIRTFLRSSDVMKETASIAVGVILARIVNRWAVVSPAHVR